jgi:hypothetical protein
MIDVFGWNEVGAGVSTSAKIVRKRPKITACERALYRLGSLQAVKG